MVNSLKQRHAQAANPRSYLHTEMSEPTVASADQWYELFASQGDTTTAFGAGFGPNDDRRNSGGWSDLDIKDNSTTPVSVDGVVRFRVYRDSSKDQLIAQSGAYQTQSLRSAVADGRKDKVLIPGMLSKVAGNDSYLTVEFKPAAGSAGATVSSANSDSDLGLAYSELPM